MYQYTYVQLYIKLFVFIFFAKIGDMVLKFMCFTINTFSTSIK